MTDRPFAAVNALSSKRLGFQRQPVVASVPTTMPV
jgi:hypothetical protein